MNKTYIILSLALSLCLAACDSEPKRTSEDASLTSDSIYQTGNDTVYEEWGAPSPPPEVTGDGSSLFDERRNPNINIDGSELKDNQSQDYTATNNNDVIANWINNQSTSIPTRQSSSPSRPTSQRTPRRQSNAENYTLEYNWNNDNSNASSVQNSQSDIMLPYAANNDDKKDFLNNFYAMLLDANPSKDINSSLSISCQNYLKEQNYNGRYPVENFFGVNSSYIGKPSADILKSMVIEPMDYDWFKVSWAPGINNREVELKVIEMNRQLVVDMIR